MLRNRAELLEKPYSLPTGRQAAPFNVLTPHISCPYRNSLSVTSWVTHAFSKIRVRKALKVTPPGDRYATSGLRHLISQSAQPCFSHSQGNGREDQCVSLCHLQGSHLHVSNLCQSPDAIFGRRSGWGVGRTVNPDHCSG
jgi:hypothetical protein